MTHVPKVGDGAQTIFRAAVLESLAGNYHVSGLEAEPGASGTAITTDVSAGSVRVSGTGTLDIAGDTLPHDAVANQHDYRMDLVYATTGGGLAVQKGQPAPPEPTVDGVPYQEGGTPMPPRRLFWPPAPDASTIAGVPLWVVVVSDTASDAQDLAQEDYIDYRIPPISPGEHVHPDLALNRRTYGLDSPPGEIVKLATINDGTSGFAGCRVGVWSANSTLNAQARALDVGVVTENSGWDVRAHESGVGSDTVDVFITEQDSSTTGTTQNRYHLYARAPGETEAYLTVDHRGESWGGDEFVGGLGTNDVLGTIVHDTGDPATGGVARQVAAEPTAATAGDVPVYQSDGSAAWETRVGQSGEWELLDTIRMGNRYQGSSDLWTIPYTTEQLRLVHPGLFDAPRFDTIGLALFARLSIGAQGDTAFARLGEGVSGPNDHISGTEISTGNVQNTRVFSSPPAVVDNSPREVGVQMRSEGTSTADALNPTMLVYGRHR